MTEIFDLFPLMLQIKIRVSRTTWNGRIYKAGSFFFGGGGGGFEGFIYLGIGKGTVSKF